MLELLFLLLPIAAAYGWYMGNRSASNDRQEQSNHMSRQYVAGLNMLLSDESDKQLIFLSNCSRLIVKPLILTLL